MKFNSNITRVFRLFDTHLANLEEISSTSIITLRCLGSIFSISFTVCAYMRVYLHKFKSFCLSHPLFLTCLHSERVVNMLKIYPETMKKRMNNNKNSAHRIQNRQILASDMFSGNTISLFSFKINAFAKRSGGKKERKRNGKWRCVSYNF